MKAEKNEQWKLDGKCSKCRRQSYCGTECKASKERRMISFKKLLQDEMFLKKFKQKG